MGQASRFVNPGRTLGNPRTFARFGETGLTLSAVAELSGRVRRQYAAIVGTVSRCDSTARHGAARSRLAASLLRVLALAASEIPPLDSLRSQAPPRPTFAFMAKHRDKTKPGRLAPCRVMSP